MTLMEINVNIAQTLLFALFLVAIISGKEINDMEPISLSILVVNCKDYKPYYNWYLCKSGMHFSAAVKSPDSRDFDEARLHEYDSSDDYVLRPECPRMSDEEAAEVVRDWCLQNDIPYIDDLDEIEAAYHWYYKYSEYDEIDHPTYVCHLCGERR